MQLYKHVAGARRRVRMSSNAELFEAVQVRLKLRGKWPPPKLSVAARLQKWRDDNRHNPFDLDAILKEARDAGAGLAEIIKFRAKPHDLQVQEILTGTNTAEPQLAEEAEGEYLAREAKKRATWLAQKDRLNLDLEQRQQQSERDKTRYITPTGTPVKTRSGTTFTPESVYYDLTTPDHSSRKKYNFWRKHSSQRSGSTESWIENEKREGSERKRRNQFGESHEWGTSEYRKSLQEAFQSTLQMSPTPAKKAPSQKPLIPIPAEHGSLVYRTRPRADATSMDPSKSTGATAELDSEMEKNVEINPAAAGPAEVTNKPKKEKAPKQPKAPKTVPATAPLTPAVIDLRVGHILRAIEHPNADTMYVSTIAMGDPEGAEHTEVDEQTGKVVRTVCSGLKAFVKLEDMQDRKIVVVANLKPANLRSIKSAAMVLAASPKPEEGADPHSPDRTVELVQPPPGSEAGDKVYFEGWPYGDGKGPEKQLNPKKKTWEMLQPGFYTTDNLVVAFDSSKSEMEDKSSKGELVVEGKGKCTVASLKGAIVR